MFKIKSTLKIKIKIICLGILLVLNNLSFGPLLKPAQAQELESQTVESILPLAMESDEQVLALPIVEETKPLIDKPVLLEPELEPEIDKPVAPIEEQPLETLVEEDPEPNFDKGENKISLEKLNLKTEGNSGALVYDFPIQVPQGRNGLQPNLALSYNNQDNDKFNQFGAGWSLNIPSIKRINKKGSDNLYTEAYFSSSLSGELRLVSSSDGLHGEYQAEVESGDFIKYELTENNYWQATDKTGTVYTFGFNTNSRQDNPSDQNQIYQWLLTETRDTNDNYIKYEYFKDAGQIYPDTITYTGNGETDGVFKVEFIRENRLDKPSSLEAGFEISTNYRIRQITTSINNEWVKKYYLSYKSGDNGHSQLTGIQEGARDLNLPDYQHNLDTDTIALWHMNGEVASHFKKDNAQGESIYDLREAGEITTGSGLDGLANGAYHFNGYDGCLETNLDFEPHMNSFTIDAWVKTTAGGNGYFRIVSASRQYNGANSIRLYMNHEGKVFFEASWPGSMGVANVGTYGNQVRVNDGQWHYITAVMYNSNVANAKLYIDSILVGEGSHPSQQYQLYNFGDYWSIGSVNCSGDFFNGDIDEVRISDKARTQQEITNYYNDSLNSLNNASELLQNENEFAYQTPNTTFSLEEDYEFPVYFSEPDMSKGVEIADINGDGLGDVIVAFGRPNIVNQTYVNNGHGWYHDQNLWFPLLFVDGPSSYDQGVRFGDINGDNLLDIIKSNIENGSNHKGVYLNNGYGWDNVSENWDFPLVFMNAAADLGVRLADVNGDGLVDIIKGFYRPPYEYNDPIIDIRDVYINSGHGWDLDVSWQFPVNFIYDGHDRGVRLADVNGDGLVDVLHGYGTDHDVYINNGHGWNLDASYILPISMFEWGIGDVGVRPFDINADGLDDIVRSWRQPNGGELRHYVFINKSRTWDEYDFYDEKYQVPLPFVQMYINTSSDLHARLADLNGDNVSDLVRSVRYRSQGEYDPVSVKKMYINNAQAEFLSTIKNSQGAEINISYQPSTQYKDQSGDLLNPHLPFAVQTVKQITINDGLDNQSTIDYQYSDGQYYYDNPEQRKVAGFGKVEKTIADTKTITYYHQGNGLNYSQGEYQDSYAKIGRPYRSETYDNNTDTLLSQELYKWEETDLGHDNSFVYNTLKSSTDFTNTTKSTAIEYQYSTTNGNLLTENNLGEVVINTGTGEITNQLIGDEKNTNYDYAQNLDDHILAAPKTKTISDTTDSKQQNLYYDNLALGEVAKVNLTKEDYLEQDVEVNRNFNDLGLVTEEISPKNATTTIAYDTYDMYPASSTDPLNNVTYTEYNLLNGQVATTTAANGLTTVNKYDAFGRLKEVWISNPDSPSTLIKKQEISYQDTTLPRY